MVQTARQDGAPIGRTQAQFHWVMGLFTNMYGRDLNLKQVMMEKIIAGKRELHFKDDNHKEDIGMHLDRVDDIVWYINCDCAQVIIKKNPVILTM